jgi:hypothetical protein
MWQEAAALRDFNPTFVRFGVNRAESDKGRSPVHVRSTPKADLSSIRLWLRVNESTPQIAKSSAARAGLTRQSIPLE